MGTDPKKAVEVLEEAIGELGGGDRDLALELETQLIGFARQEPDLYSLAAARLHALRAVQPQLAGAEQVVLANLASDAARAGERKAEALDLAERALAGGGLLAEHFDPAFLYAVQVLAFADRLDSAFRLYGEAIEHARQRGLIAQFCIASCYRSAVAFRRGSLSEAVADVELCLGVVDSNDVEFVRPYAVAFLQTP